MLALGKVIVACLCSACSCLVVVCLGSWSMLQMPMEKSTACVVGEGDVCSKSRSMRLVVAPG